MSPFAKCSEGPRVAGLVVAVATAGFLLPAFSGASEPEAPQVRGLESGTSVPLALVQQTRPAPPSGPPGGTRQTRSGGGSSQEGGDGCSEEALESDGCIEGGGSQEPLRPQGGSSRRPPQLGGGASSASAPAGIADPGGRGNLGLTSERAKRADPRRVRLARTGHDAGPVALLGLALLGTGVGLQHLSRRPKRGFRAP